MGRTAIVLPRDIAIAYARCRADLPVREPGGSSSARSEVVRAGLWLEAGPGALSVSTRCDSTPPCRGGCADLRRAVSVRSGGRGISKGALPLRPTRADAPAAAVGIMPRRLPVPAKASG